MEELVVMVGEPTIQGAVMVEEQIFREAVMVGEQTIQGAVMVEELIFQEAVRVGRINTQVVDIVDKMEELVFKGVALVEELIILVVE